MQRSALPSASDLAGLVGYLWNNPYLFISSTTVMTTGLILGAIVVTALPVRTSLLRRAAPALAILLTYFGLGSFALSLEILLRFHTLLPYETEVQFVSGIGHLAEALVGIALLFAHLRGQPAAAWLWGHNAALAYWLFQVRVLTPPWFAWEGQEELVVTATLCLLAVAAGANVLLWRTLSGRSAPPARG